MDNLKMKQSTLLLDTIGFYNSQNRAVNKESGNCVYAPIKGVSPGCAIGRKLPVLVAREIDILGILNVGNSYVQERLTPELKELGNGFLDRIQTLHDHENNWTDAGISATGLLHANNIITEFKLPIKKLK